MKRILILTSDKSRAIRLRTLLEGLGAEFEIAIGEEGGRSVLTQRYMNLIVVEVSTLKAGTSWIFPFLARKGLKVPVVVLGADENSLKNVPPDTGGITYVPAPLNQAKLELALKAG